MINLEFHIMGLILGLAVATIVYATGLLRSGRGGGRAIEIVRLTVGVALTAAFPHVGFATVGLLIIASPIMLIVLAVKYSKSTTSNVAAESTTVESA